VNEICNCHWFPQNYAKRWLLTDFGFSTVIEERGFSHGRRGTPGYRAPELLEEKYDDQGNPLPAEFSRKSDIWALGCILYRIASKDQAFRNDDKVKSYVWGSKESPLPQIDELTDASYDRVIYCSKKRRPLPFREHLNLIIESCLAKQPSDRPTAMQLKVRFEELKARLMIQQE
jgi:serine/threonine protein kinase